MTCQIETDAVNDILLCMQTEPLSQVHKEVIQMADPDESNPLKRLAALLLHAADLANGADPWSLSALWARLCHQGKQLKPVVLHAVVAAVKHR
jgi:hypothetical protein